MKPIPRIICLLILLALAVNTAAAPAAVSSTDLASIDAFVLERMQASSIPGLSFAIVDGGQIVHSGAYGVRGPGKGGAFTPQTPGGIASVGKTFTALALRQLINAGKIEEDAPVARYLPWFTLADSGAVQQITVRHLLEHRSGISTLAGNAPDFYRSGQTTQELVRRLAGVRLNRPVGTSVEYSNFNYLILGAVVESAARMTYSDYVQRYIFDPLEMRRCYFTEEAAQAAGMSSGYRYSFGIPLAVDIPLPQGQMPAGMHLCSAEDMAHYLIAFSEHGLYHGVSVVHQDGAARPGDEQIDYNIDWIPYRLPNPGDTPGHAGGWLNYSAGIYYMPARHLGVVVLANAFPGQWLPVTTADQIALDVLRLYTGSQPSPAKPRLLTLYLLVDLLLLLMIGYAVWRAVSLKRPVGRWLHVLLLDGIVPLIFLTVLPAAFASLPGQVELSPVKNFERILFAAPDLGWVWLGTGLAVLAVGLIKGVKAVLVQKL